MKVIFDNIIFTLQCSGGISSIWAHILSGALRDNELDVLCLDYPNESNVFRSELNIDAGNIIKSVKRTPRISRYLSPGLKSEYKCIFHSSYYRTCIADDISNITTVHDFVYEKFIGGIAARVHSWQKRRAVLNSDVIVCVSENTKRDLFEFIPECAEKDVRVIHNGISDAYKPASVKPCPEFGDCVLFVGSRAAYKNFELTVDSLADSGYRLLICGDELTPGEIQLLNSRLDAERYLYIGNVNETRLNEIYNSAFCLAYPSNYEGFGLPVIEAQRAKCPVIALKSSSIPEIIGQGYPMMESNTVEEFKRVLKIFEDKRGREALLDSGYENSLRFTMREMTDKYLALYKSILQ